MKFDAIARVVSHIVICFAIKMSNGMYSTQLQTVHSVHKAIIQTTPEYDTVNSSTRRLHTFNMTV